VVPFVPIYLCFKSRDYFNAYEEDFEGAFIADILYYCLCFCCCGSRDDDGKISFESSFA
jgi:hypothetical protein